MPVQRMAAFLSEYDDNELLATIVHGSLATGEDIAYSDFDAVAIITDATMRDPSRLAALVRRLAHARLIMFEYDPLQHHGWFVLTEADLWSYSEAMLPSTILEQGRLLGRRQALDLQVRQRVGDGEALQVFLSATRSLQANLSLGRAFRNMYHLKSTLSLFMLLPSLYLHAKTGRPFAKRLSFVAAQNDFSEQEWSAMARVSAIRDAWSYKISRLRRWVVARPWVLRRHVARLLAPPVPSSLRRMVSQELCCGMLTLAAAMAVRLGVSTVASNNGSSRRRSRRVAAERGGSPEERA